MESTSFSFVQARAVRRAVVPEGDIREDVAFQNDINGLLARFEGKNLPMKALGWIQEPVTGANLSESAALRPQLRIIMGGVRSSVAISRKERSPETTPAPQVIVAQGA